MNSVIIYVFLYTEKVLKHPSFIDREQIPTYISIYIVSLCDYIT